jgi:polysaccharide deacetylase family protein (PEP-CTERM system associated)
MTRSRVGSSRGIPTEEVPLHPPLDVAAPHHALTVDVEDWYQSCIDYDAPITERVVRNVDRLLTVFDARNVKATFFIQGMVAESFPKLVASLVEEGHEVQSHGYSHRPLFAMSRTELRAEIERGKKVVEDAAGVSVTAFRAQDFSIVETNLWALEILLESGFEVDSSIFPMRTRRYGISGSPLTPHYLLLGERGRILEVPVAIVSFGSLRFPICGGGYFRFLPRRVIERGLRAVEAEGRPGVVYVHPYEFSPPGELSAYSDVPARVRLLQGAGRSRFPDRVHGLLRRFSFGRLTDVLSAWGVS